MRPLELTGQRFGRLLVLSRAENNKHGQTRWCCQCDCGEIKSIGAMDLRTGHTKSCGCGGSRKRSKFLNLQGRKFGLLTALGYAANDKCGQAIWKCICDCGKIKAVLAGNLTRGLSKSCGCNRAVGDRHPKWKGGVASKNEQIRKSIEYKNWRTEVFIRDNFLCQECGNTGRLHAHHIKSFAEFSELRFEVSNGQTLCIPCHKKTPSYLNQTKI